MASTLSTSSQTVDEVIGILKQNGIPMDDALKEQIESILIQEMKDRDQFISHLIDAFYGPNCSALNALISLPRPVIGCVLHKFIKITDLNTDNIIKMTSIFITKLDDDGNVEIDEVHDILLRNAISGRVFVKGNEHFLNSSKFSRSFKSMKSWKANKGVFTKIWKHFNRWKDAEIGFELQIMTESVRKPKFSSFSLKIVLSLKMTPNLVDFIKFLNLMIMTENSTMETLSDLMTLKK